MKNEKGAGAVETPAKSPDTNKPAGAEFQRRFVATVEEWKKQGCDMVEAPDGGIGLGVRCGAGPAMVKASAPSTEDGSVTYHAACAKGHADVWAFVVTKEELEAEAQRHLAAVAEAQANAGKNPSPEQLEAMKRDPFKARIVIEMDVKSQSVALTDVWVPNPGAGALMALVAQHHFLSMLGRPQPQPGDLLLPKPKKLIDPKGRPLS